MDPVARRELEILSSIAEGPLVTQRALAERLGIALGLANLYLKRLARKGYIKLSTLPPHRIKYLVTPRGFAQKSRLTYEYMRYSLNLYREARRTFRDALIPLAGAGARRMALYGTGDAAELAYLTLRELGFELAGVFDKRGGRLFLGTPVQDRAELADASYDRIIIATFEEPDRQLAALGRLGIALDRVVVLGAPPRFRKRPGKRRPPGTGDGAARPMAGETAR